MLSRDRTLYLCCVLMDMMTGLVSFAVARRAGDMGIEEGMLGVIGGAFFVAYAPLAPAAGILSDRFSRRRLMVPACGVCVVAIIVLLVVTTPWLVAGAMVLFGTGMAMYWPPMVAAIAEGKTGRRLASSMATYSLAWNAGVLMGYGFGGVLYVSTVSIPPSAGPIAVPDALAGKLSYHAPTGRLRLAGTMRDAHRELITSTTDDPSVRDSLERLVNLSRHRPRPLVLGLLLPILVGVLLVAPERPARDASNDRWRPSPSVAAVSDTSSPLGPTTERAPATGRAPRSPAAVFLWTAWIASFATTMSGKGLQALFPKLADVLAVPPSVHGLLDASARAGAVAVFLLMQWSYFWHGRLWPLWLTQGLLAIGLVIVAVSNAVSGFFVAFLMNGIASGYSYYASIYYSIELSALHQKGRGSGLTEGIFASGLLVGPLAGGLVGHLLGARAPYWFFAAAVVALIGAGARLAQTKRTSQPPLPERLP